MFCGIFDRELCASGKERGNIALSSVSLSFSLLDQLRNYVFRRETMGCSEYHAAKKYREMNHHRLTKRRKNTYDTKVLSLL